MNFKYHSKYQLVLLIPLLFSLNACKDLLNPKPLLYVSEDNSIVNKKSADAALIGTYSALSQNSYQGNTFRYIVNLSDDNLRWVGNSPSNREFDVHDVFATNTSVSALWGALYSTINSSNNIIQSVPKVNDQTYLQTDRNTAIGEAYFIRALAYFDLVRLWGNVPIITESTRNPSSGDGIGNSTPAQVYKQVGEDLEAAQNMLPANPAAGNRNRASIYAVYALKSRLFLYLGQWQQAIDYADLVIKETAKFSLVPSYSAFFNAKNTTESIFEIDYTINNKNSWAGNWFASNLTGGTRELLPTDEFIALARGPYGGDRKSLLLDINTPPKGIITYGNMNFKISTGENQVYALRIAELYLIRAEARAELNRTAEAVADIRTIRLRAKAADEDLNGLTNKNLIIAKVLQERRLELAYESHRWFDLIRRGLAQQVLGISDPNKLLYPIPRQELLVDKALKQNPGYN
ncbi:RagB/SusD family nutrient uptake outer membrane protein [Pedobacter sp. N36a]|uniref:RagB/SusD family nutrient uptake outer membrane protein n=1 Tax=Pedobacter sp. N36a TaxID=2767996 RepID=UPI0016572B92|nr:RagB/SusD family nutrient uptake outer membrane protein [Pedobacter sp. N36a]MBC8986985.1 RagB/SusD family nutrient uptake outer membrane protein [Pedobacter sp. N36a]